MALISALQIFALQTNLLEVDETHFHFLKDSMYLVKMAWSNFIPLTERLIKSKKKFSISKQQSSNYLLSQLLSGFFFFKFLFIYLCDSYIQGNRFYQIQYNLSWA